MKPREASAEETSQMMQAARENRDVQNQTPQRDQSADNNNVKTLEANTNPSPLQDHYNPSLHNHDNPSPLNHNDSPSSLHSHDSPSSLHSHENTVVDDNLFPLHHDQPSPLKHHSTNPSLGAGEMMSSVLNGLSSSAKSKLSQEGDHAQSGSCNPLMSGDDSDADSPADRQAGSRDDTHKANGAGRDGGSASPSDNHPSDSKEAKRARVETILTTIRQSPQRAGFESLAQATYNEIKRQKRKQPQPQQHDVRALLAPEAKQRKVERRLLEHIHQLQQQLHAVQRSIDLDLDFDKGAGNGQEDLENDESASPCRENFVQVFGREKEVDSPTLNGFWTQSPRVMSPAPLRCSPSGNADCSKNRHLKSEDSRLSLNGHLTAPMHVQLSGHHRMSLTLKSEIMQAVKQAVDCAVITVLEKHAGQANNPQHAGLHELETQGLQQAQRQQQHVQKLPDHGGPPLSMPRLRPDRAREALKETVSNSQTEGSLELVVPNPVLLGFSAPRLSDGRPQLGERLGAFGQSLQGSHPVSELIKPHSSTAPPFLPHYPFNYLPHGLLPPVFPTVEPEQTEALPLVVSAMSKMKKRTKVTDTRLSPRVRSSPGIGLPVLMAAREVAEGGRHPQPLPPSPFNYPFLPPILPTSVAITNPSLHRSDFLGLRFQDLPYNDDGAAVGSPPPALRRSTSPGPSPPDSVFKADHLDTSAPGSPVNGQTGQKIYTLTPLHLRKAKLIFFYARYPNSGILKMYFPDVAFNKNNTAQLVKWFSNFREFFYIQMEKQARQAARDGCTHSEDLVISRDGDLFRQLNQHYNRNNQIEAPETFRSVAEATLREFFRAIHGKRDLDASWKKSIYKVIARMDEPLPDFFRSHNWMEQLADV